MQSQKPRKIMKQPDWNRDDLTFGDTLGGAMEVQTQKEANEYLANLIKYQMKVSPDLTEEKSKEMSLHNIGYYTGYYGSETAGRVLPLFKTAHPIFGKTQPSPDKAYKLGVEMGKNK